MLVNVEEVLKPYADSQPEFTKLDTKLIERIPLIIDPATGQITQQFQQFYDQVVRCCTDTNWFNLYNISDKFLDIQEFKNLWISTISPTWTKFVELDNRAKGIDIELNIDRFKSTHRNLIGSFLIMIYMLEIQPNDLEDHSTPMLKQYTTEILFTFKGEEFTVLSCLKPFIANES